MYNYKLTFDNSLGGNEPLFVRVTFQDGRIYQLAFYDPNMAQIEVINSRNGCFAMPALILLDKVSMDKVKKVINDIAKSGYFDHLMPIKKRK